VTVSSAASTDTPNSKYTAGMASCTTRNGYSAPEQRLNPTKDHQILSQTHNDQNKLHFKKNNTRKFQRIMFDRHGNACLGDKTKKKN